MSSRSRGALRPRFANRRPKLRGRRECRVPAGTRGLVCKLHARMRTVQVQPEQPGIPAMVLRLMPRSVWRPLASIANELMVRIARLSFANLRRLDTSNGRQDTRFCRTHQRRSSARCVRSRSDRPANTPCAPTSVHRNLPHQRLHRRGLQQGPAALGARIPITP